MLSSFCKFVVFILFKVCKVNLIWAEVKSYPPL